MKTPDQFAKLFFHILLFATLSSHSWVLAQREAQVSSLKPEELVEFETQPEKVRKILSYALDLTGKNLAYQYGSNHPSNGGLDCSGTVNHILTHLGYRSPRQSNTIFLWVRKNGNLHEVNAPTSLNDSQMAGLKPGDILFWEGTYDVGDRFPATSHVMIFLGHRKSDRKPVMVGASSGRSYNGRARHGVSVFDFRLPGKGSISRFVGYGPVPGVKNLGIKLPPLRKPEVQPGLTTTGKPSVPVAKQIETKPEPVELRQPWTFPPDRWGAGQHSAVAKARDSVTKEPWRYLVYLPENYTAGKEALPMILYLHGRSIRGADLEMVKRYGPPALLDRRRDFPFVVVSPQLPDGSWPAKSLAGLLDEITDTYRVDPSRIYLTGVSMGGGGAWNLAAAAPERFAALAPVCGYGHVSIASKLIGIPIRAYHGAIDEIVPIGPHQDLVAVVNREGGSASLITIPDGTHGNIIMPVYRDQSLYDWFLAHSRSDRIRPAVVTAVIPQANVISDLPPPVKEHRETGATTRAQIPVGKWTVVEQVIPENGGWRIEWDYTFRLKENGKLTGRGNKARVNGKAATKGERDTRAEFELIMNGSRGEGGVLETAWNGKEYPGRWVIEMAPDNLSFEGTFYDSKGKAAARLTGQAREPVAGRTEPSSGQAEKALQKLFERLLGR